MTPDRKEVWVRVHENHAMQQAIVTVRSGQVLVSQSTLNSVMGTRAETTEDDEPTWHVTYEVMAELLVMNDFYKWPPGRD